jgi:hypothetical protein
MSNYYSKLTQCDYCKDLDCEIVMVKNEVLGFICPQCQIVLAGQEKHITAEKEQMAIEIETY